MEILDYRAIDNSDVEIYPSEFPVQPNYESVPDIDTTAIKSTNDDEMVHLPAFFHS